MKAEEWGAQGTGCTQKAQVGSGSREDPQGHQCQAGKPICARHSREREEGLDNSQCHGSPVLMQSMLQMGKGKLRPAPLPVAPAVSQVQQGHIG